MLYAIGLIDLQKTRDILLENLLSEDESTPVFNKIDNIGFLVKIDGRCIDVISCDKTHREIGIRVSTKWKTLKGVNDAIARVENKLPGKQDLSGRRNRGDVRANASGRQNWEANQWMPIIYEISEEWNAMIQKDIDAEEKLFKIKIDNLRKKLAK